MTHEQALTRVKPNKVGPLTGPKGGFGGSWKNEYNSTMNLIEKGDQISGIYSSKVSDTGKSINGTLLGFVSDDIISFVVKWDGLESMTAWVGQVVDINGTETIKTLWHLIRDIPDSEEPSGLWTTILAGDDAFTR